MERLDDLQFKNLKLWQDPDRFCFGTDSVLLSAFTRVKPQEKTLDLCAGTGVIATLLHGRTGVIPEALEIDPALCSLFRKSCEINSIPILIHCMNLIGAAGRLGYEKYEVIVCNPPYFHAGSVSPVSARANARHAGFEPVCLSVEQLLKNGGKFFLCYPADQLANAIVTLCAHKLEPKRLRLVSHTVNSKPYLALIECRKQAAPGLIFEPNLYLTEPDGRTPSPDYKEIYHL